MMMYLNNSTCNVILHSQVVRNKSYWVLAVSFGAGIAIFTALSTLLEQILAPKGYSNVSLHITPVCLVKLCTLKVTYLPLGPHSFVTLIPVY